MVNSLKFDLKLSENDKYTTIISDKDILKVGKVEHEFYNIDEYQKFSFDLSLISYLRDSIVNGVEISNLEVSFKRNGLKENLESDYNKFDIIDSNSELLPYMSTIQSGYPTSSGNIYIKDTTNDNILIYGPYINLKKGKYKVEYTLDDFTKSLNKEKTLNLDVVSNFGEKIISLKEFSPSEYVLENGKIRLVIPFQIEEESEDNIEFRLKGNNLNGLTIIGVRLIKVND